VQNRIPRPIGVAKSHPEVLGLQKRILWRTGVAKSHREVFQAAKSHPKADWGCKLILKNTL
jgi:hypothetical protein